MSSFNALLHRRLVVVVAAILSLSTGSILAETPKPVEISNFPDTTHMGRTPAEHVVLHYHSVGPDPTNCSAVEPVGNKEYRRLFPDGTQATEEFIVPAGKVLVITDFDVIVSNGVDAFDVGRTVISTILINPTQRVSTWYHSTEGVKITADNAGGPVAISENLGSGIVVGAGSFVCPQSFQMTGIGFNDARTENSVMRGYLMDAQP